MFYISNELMYEIRFKNNKIFPTMIKLCWLLNEELANTKKINLQHFSTLKENMLTKKTYYDEEKLLKIDK
jgi:hypothetical protein